MSKTINFCSCPEGRRNIVHSSLQSDSVRHTTQFFRADLNWGVLADSILTSPIRDIYAGACADGSEVISLKMLLEKKAPERKFNFVAFDIAADKIQAAQKGIVELWDKTLVGTDCCLQRCQDYVGEKIFNKNLQKIQGSDFDPSPKNQQRGGALYQMTDHLRKNLSFYKADILKISGQKFEEPICLLFRNVWPYLKTSVQNKLGHDLEKNLHSGSIVALGDYDNLVDPDRLLRKSYFDNVGYSTGRIFRHL